MNLHEYQAKKLFLKFNIPILKNRVFSDISEIKSCIASMKHEPPWIVKCQIHSGGRGQSGGVRIISSVEDIISFANQWLGNRLITNQTSVSGEVVNHILIEPAVKIIHEFYFSILLDRDLSKIICMVSSTGGMNIEHIISQSPDLIYKIDIDPVLGIHPYQGRILARQLNLTGIQINQFTKIYNNLTHMFFKEDLMLVEVNPLVITTDYNMLCLDAKVTIDQNALFRHQELLDLYFDNHEFDHVSLSTNRLESNYVDLDGNIGCIVNGAGLAMATMDLMQSLGGFPANFLDIGGDTDQNYIVSALVRLLNNTKVKAIFINIFGGIVCCDLVAKSIITALSRSTISIPIVVRLEGNNSVLGSDRLTKSNLNIIVNNNLVNAIKQVIQLVK